MPNFGDLSDGRPFWTGDFTGVGRAGILFYGPDDLWWLGMRGNAGFLDDTPFTWSKVGSSRAALGPAINDGRPFLKGRFTRAGSDEILMYNPFPDDWWIG